MIKKIVFWLIISVIIMFALPWIAVTFVKGENGMAVCFVLFYAVNPAYSMVLGIFSAEDARKLWWLPVISAVFFLVGTWIFFDMNEIVFIVYAAVYLALGVAAMLLSMFVRRINN